MSAYEVRIPDLGEAKGVTVVEVLVAVGAAVKKDDPLFQIDARPFQAAVDQAHAKLAQSQAQAQKAALDVQRYTPLAKEQAAKS